MNVGYLRLNLAISLDYNKTSTEGGHSERLGLFKMFVDNGNNVKILTTIKKDHEHCLQDPIWQGKITYDKGNPAGCDFLFIEQGPTNTTFTDKDGSYMQQVVDILEKFEGLVFYHQSDLALEIPIAELDKKWNNPEVKPNNIKNMCKFEMMKHRKFVILTKAKHTQMFLDLMDKKYRAKYKTLKLPCYTFNVPYPDFLIPKLENIKNKTLSYVGNQRDAFRINNMQNFLSKSKMFYDYDINVWGKWEKQFPGITYHGKTNNESETIKIYNESKLTFLNTDKVMYQCGTLTQRIFEANAAGCLLVGLKGMYKIEEELLPELLINDATDMVNIVRKINSLTPDEYLFMLEKQQQKLNDRNNFTKLYNQLMKIVEVEK